MKRLRLLLAAALALLLAPGTATATDPEGASASDAFAVAVEVANRPPVVVATPSSQRLYWGSAGGIVVVLDLVFDDPDGDALAYAATVADDAIVTLTGLEGGTLRLFGASPGSTTVAVTATDPAGAAARVDIAVEVLRLPGDFDDSGAVDSDDFFAFADHFGSTTADPPSSPVSTCSGTRPGPCLGLTLGGDATR